MLTDRILESGPSDDLIRRPLFEPRSGFVPRPVGYEEAFDRLRRIGTPMNEEERAEVAQLRNLGKIVALARDTPIFSRACASAASRRL